MTKISITIGDEDGGMEFKFNTLEQLNSFLSQIKHAGLSQKNATIIYEGKTYKQSIDKEFIPSQPNANKSPSPSMGLPTKIKVKSIQFGFSESPHINKGITFPDWESAENYLTPIIIATELAKKGGTKSGYYKTDFTITFEDGEVYKGRYDIGSDESTLRQHVRRFIETYSGRVKPGHMSNVQWQAYCRDGINLDLGVFLDNYDI